jgi:hypothetical protein
MSSSPVKGKPAAKSSKKEITKEKKVTKKTLQKNLLLKK